MQVRSEVRTQFSEEIRFIPRWAWVLAAIGFVAAQIFFATFVARQPDTPPPALRTLLGVLAGIILGCYRQPLQGRCPQCEAVVQSGFNFCPKCNHQLHPTCPHCQHAVLGNDVYCAYCGGTLAPPNNQVPTSSMAAQQ